MFQVRRFASLRASTLMEVACHIAAAVNVMHSRGIIHGDIKVIFAIVTMFCIFLYFFSVFGLFILFVLVWLFCCVLVSWCCLFLRGKHE